MWLGRFVAVASAAALCLSAYGQAPDVRFHIDATLAYDTLGRGTESFHFYDPYGHTSIASISALFNTGLRGYVSERIERISGDPSSDPFEEYYVEDEGIWRLGKQYLPFGSGTILRENVLAGQGTLSVLEHLDLNAAICDAGTGQQQGFIGRLGERFGISAAIGRHFGISPTSFDLIRQPTESPGDGRGWKQILGADGYQRNGRFTTRGEMVLCSGGETSRDGDLNLLDVSETYQWDKVHNLALGWTHTAPDDQNFVRLQGTAGLVRGATLVPSLRFKGSRIYDFSLALRVRI